MPIIWPCAWPRIGQAAETARRARLTRTDGRYLLLVPMSRRFAACFVACVFTLGCGSGKPAPAASASEEKASGSDESSDGEAKSESSGEGQKSSGEAVGLPEKCSGSD